MPWFSVVIITKNEEKNIRRCLESVKDLTDDIVVVDSQSVDKTEQICNSYDVRFLQREFDGYGNQKNWGNNEAKYDYILSIDADEELSDQLRNSIQNRSLPSDNQAFIVKRKSNYCGKWINHSGWYPDKKIRLWNKNFGRWNLDLVHEKLVLDEGVKSILLDGDLLHYPFRNVEEHLLQIDLFTSLRARSDFMKGKKAAWLKKIFFPPIRFLKLYFFKLGFLDGKNGWIICWNSAYASYLRYSKLRTLNRSSSNEE